MRPSHACPEPPDVPAGPGIAYRRDIDGLRALAVLSVIGFHAFPGWVQGGYIGVDIFFVISGYLITAILLAEQAAGELSIARFYERRIRRIFPSLAVVIGACLAFGWVALLADEYSQLGKHAAAGAGFVANLAYWSEAGYFDTASELKPLLHLWSLGIEEQFYIAWPAIILLAARLRFNLVLVTGAIVAASFSLSASATGADPTAAFYSPLARSWELLAGGALAGYAAAARANGRILPARPWVAELVAAAGLGILAVGIFVMDKELPFPGWWALVPTLGTLLVLVAGDEARLSRWLLGNRLAVGIGLISYALYLWHWPLLAFARIMDSGELPRTHRIAAVVLAMLLAWLTYRVVETPLRSSRHRGTPLLLLLLVACLGGAGYGIHLGGGLGSRLPPSVGIHEQLEATGSGAAGSCLDALPPDRYRNNICRRTTAPRVAIVGDSHAGHLFDGFRQSGDKVFGQVLVVGRGSCPPVLGVGTLPGCEEVMKAALRVIEVTPSVEFVLLSSYHDAVFMGAPKDDRTAQEALFLRGHGEFVRRLWTMGKPVYFVQDVPTLDFNPEMCLKRPLRLPYSAHAECAIPASRHRAARAGYDRQVARLIDQEPGLRLLETGSVFCNDQRCTAIGGDGILFKDFNHLSGEGSRRVARSLIAQMSAATPP